MAIITVLCNSLVRARGGAVWQLVGLITRRSQVQILPPQPRFVSDLMKYGSFFKNKTIDRCGCWVDWVPGVDGLAGAVRGAGW